MALGCGGEPAANSPIDDITEDGGTQGENPPFSCPTSSNAGSLAMIPDTATVFVHTTAECNALNPSVIVRNTGAITVQVQALGVADDAFRARSEPLPLELAPGESMPVVLSYRPPSGSDGDTGVMSTLNVLTSTGCSQFPMMGLAVDQGGAFTQDVYAIDFGDVPVGQVSEVREVQVLYQAVDRPTPSTLDGFVTGSNAFEVVSPPGKLTPQSCEVVTVGIRFRPDAVGAFESSLNWFVETPPQEGLAFVGLFGRGIP